MLRPCLLLLSPAPPADALSALARSLFCFSPRVGLLPDREIVLEIGTTAHLFGGEARLAAEILRTVRSKGYDAHLAVAGSLAAARLAAYFGDGRQRGDADRGTPAARTVEHGGGNRRQDPGAAPQAVVRLDTRSEAQLLAALPLERLYELPGCRPAPPDRKLLSFLGIATLGDLRRHAPRLVQGLLSDPLRELLLYAARSPKLEDRIIEIREETRFEESFCFAPPVTRVSPVLFCLRPVLERLLAAGLQPRGLLLSGLTLLLVTETRQEIRVDISPAAPTGSVKLLMELCRLKLDRVELDSPVAECRVVADRLAPRQARSYDLLAPAQHRQVSLEHLASRLDGLLDAPLSLFRLAPHDAHLPEHQFRPVPATGSPGQMCPSRKPLFVSPRRGEWPESGEGRGGTRRLGLPGEGVAAALVYPILLFSPTIPAMALPARQPRAVSPRRRPGGVPERLALRSLGEAGSEGEGVAEYEFHDPDLHRTVVHRYAHFSGPGGRKLLVKQVDGGPVQLVGLFCDGTSPGQPAGIALMLGTHSTRSVSDGSRVAGTAVRRQER